jgi:ubiquinone/menaquinone biosynthesis C-methylase UbiE
MSEYLSTVTKSGQFNTPPGSYLAVKEWAQFSFMNQQSKVLEIGCSNGFISIELARYTGATCVGIDLDDQSVQSAKQNIDKYVADKVSFQQGDAGQLSFKDACFSHVVVSGHLPFVEPRDRCDHINKTLHILKP